MSNFMKLQDRFISWVEITNDNNVIHFATSSQDQSGTYDEITIEEGIYYCYKAESPPSSFPSLYGEINSKMNALGSTIYEIKAYTKDNYPIRNRHIEIEKSNTSNLEPIQFLASSTFDLRYLGFTNTTDPVFDPQDDSGITQSPYPYRGAWVPYTSVGLRSDKRSFESVDVSFSDEDTRRAYPLTKRRGKIRTFRWDYVDPYCIFEDRASDPNYKPHSRFADDTAGNNALDTWWNQWSSGSQGQGSLSQGPIGLRPYLVTHDGGPNSGLRLTSGGSQAEVIIPSSQSEIANFEEIVSLRNVSGEFYDITFSCWVIDWEGVGGYDY